MIRKAKLREVEEIASLWNIFHKEHDANVIKYNKHTAPHMAKKKDAKKQFAKYIKRCIHSKNSTVFVAEENNKLVGYSLLLIKKNIPIFTIEKLGYMADLFVKKEYRGTGISSKFKDQAKSWFKKKGVKYISIMVYPENKHAHNIYKNWGFFNFHYELRSKVD